MIASLPARITSSGSSATRTSTNGRRRRSPTAIRTRSSFEIGGTPDAAVNEVISGKADAFSTAQSENPPSEGAAGSRSRPATRARCTSNPQPATISLFLNTRLAPFDRLDVRRALNYAADRNAAVKAARRAGRRPADVPDPPAVLPGLPAVLPLHGRPDDPGNWTAPDLAKARALVARSGTRGMKVTVWSWADLRGIGPYTVKLLRSLGYRAVTEVRRRPRLLRGRRRLAHEGADRDGRMDLRLSRGLRASSTPVLTCDSFLPRSPFNSNAAEFCNPGSTDRWSEPWPQQANPDAARGLWESIDRQTVDQAPWVPLVNPKVVDVLSKRVGNYQYSPAGFGMLIDQLWVR